MEAVNGHDGVSFIFGTGSQYYDEVLEKAESRGIEIRDNIRGVKSYINDMESYLGAADLYHQPGGSFVCCGDYSMRKKHLF